MPAPPPESEPAMARTRGGVGIMRFSLWPGVRPARSASNIPSPYGYTHAADTVRLQSKLDTERLQSTIVTIRLRDTQSLLVRSPRENPVHSRPRICSAWPPHRPGAEPDCSGQAYRHLPQMDIRVRGWQGHGGAGPGPADPRSTRLQTRA